MDHALQRQTSIALLLISLAVPAHAATLTGWVSDESCGAEHVKPGKESCVVKCLRGGAGVGHPEWLPQRMVIVADDNTIWIVENPKPLERLAGRHVTVDATLHARTRSVRVLHVRSK